ncbi:hypothetical protein [Pseudonocardia acaciae]|uniref:hypothetical protein n=1 Tax=Pseudonocardia acaciae TaxID=551276 RepID=UPI000AD32350|nr:hypothetical protein [Pseudonocardia acaciae]
MEPIPCFNYDAFPLEQKHQWMQSGPGGAAAIGFGGGLAQLGADFAASDANVGQNLIQRKLADDWQGSASSAAGDAVNQAAASLAGTSVPGRRGGDSSQQYGESFNVTKNAIPTAPSVGENGFWGRAADELGREFNDMFGSTFGVQSDYSKRLAAHRAADQAANDALRRHEDTARTALTAYQGAITVPAASGRSGADGGAPRRGLARAAARVRCHRPRPAVEPVQQAGRTRPARHRPAATRRPRRRTTPSRRCPRPRVGRRGSRPSQAAGTCPPRPLPRRPPPHRPCQHRSSAGTRAPATRPAPA